MSLDVYVKHRTILRLLGISLPGENSKNYVLFFKCVFLTLSLLFPTCAFCFLLGSIYYTDYSFTARLYSVTGVISCTSAFIKLQILYWNKHQIKILMDHTNGFRVDTRTGKNTYTMTIIYELLTIAYRSISVLEVIIKRPKRLVMPFWTPFVVAETPGASGAMFAFFQTSMMLKTMSNFPVDTLFLHIANQICQKLHVLKNKLENIGKDDKKDYAILKACLDEHNEILRLIKILSGILDRFFVPLAFNSFTSILFAFFLVSQSDDMVKEMFKIAPWTTVIFAQIYIACWAGEIIKKRCGDIHFAVFNNNWYNSNQNIKKSLQIVQIFTTKPIILRGAYVFELTHHTYEAVVREVFSSFTVLYQLFNQK